LAPVAVVAEVAVQPSEVAEVEEEVVVVAVAVLASVPVVAAPASVNTPVRRKAKRLRKNQRESLYPHLAGGHCCDLPIPTHSHL